MPVEVTPVALLATIVHAARHGDRRAATWLRRRLSAEDTTLLLDAPRMPSRATLARLVEQHEDAVAAVARHRGARAGARKPSVA